MADLIRTTIEQDEKLSSPARRFGVSLLKIVGQIGRQHRGSRHDRCILFCDLSAGIL